MDIFLAPDTNAFSAALFFVGIISGFIGAMGGSGGLILLPFMIACGIPPAQSLGSARLAAMGAWILASAKFAKERQVRWKELPLIALIAVISGVIGTYIIIDIDKNYIYPVVGTILIMIALLTFVKRNFGLETKIKSHKSRVVGLALYLLIMIYGGFFGAGASFVAISIFVSFLGFRVLQAHATQMMAWVIMSVFSSAVFIFHGQVNYTHAAIIFVSMGIGSYVGSHCAIKAGDRIIKNFVCVFSLLVGLKLLFIP